MALVGLHIIHKTTSNPQWIWSTFEHVMNAPDQASVAAGSVRDDYTFYRTECTPMDLPSECFQQQVPSCVNPTNPPVQTSCAVNETPAFCLDLGNPRCPPYPVQVSRVTPIQDSGDNQVVTLNQQVHAMIRAQARPDSVWQNYQLIGALWSGAPVDENLPGSRPATERLAVSGMRPSPSAQPIANTMLETYIQRFTCVDCHRGAQISGAGGHGIPAYTSDYSFTFQKAVAPSQP